MTRLLRNNPMPILLVLLAIMPAAMGMARGIVRCEHNDASAHLATANHHEQVDADADCCCGSEHDAPANEHPEVPCDDTPIEVEVAPTQLHSVTLDLPDAPLLPVFAWLAFDPAPPVAGGYASTTPLHPPGPAPSVLLATARFLI
ncbi:MAG: hypothetical protein ACIAXF_03575 [Phycisphaerales bacterium JB063]